MRPGIDIYRTILIVVTYYNLKLIGRLVTFRCAHNLYTYIVLLSDGTRLKLARNIL
jgi:hypothetical protein